MVHKCQQRGWSLTKVLCFSFVLQHVIHLKHRRCSWFSQVVSPFKRYIRIISTKCCLIVWSKFVRFAHLTFIRKLFRAKNESTWPTFGFETNFFGFFFLDFFSKFFCFLLKLSYHMLCFHGFFSYACINFQFVNDIFSLFSIEYSWTICDFLEEKRAYCCCCCFYMIEMVLFERNLQNCAIFPSARKALSTTFSVVFFSCFSQRLCHFT